jgi:pyocin large subunit-like protein
VTGKDPEGLANNNTAQIINLIQQTIAKIQQIINSIRGGGGNQTATSNGGNTSQKPQQAQGAGSGSSSFVYHSANSDFGNSANTDVFGTLMPRLNSHFARHGKAFGAETPEDYNQMANDFLHDLPNNPNAEVKFNPNDNTVRAYDSTTNTFGAYNPEKGAPNTFFKPDPAEHGLPTNADYWKSMPGEALSSEEIATLIALFFPK